MADSRTIAVEDSQQTHTADSKQAPAPLLPRYWGLAAGALTGFLYFLAFPGLDFWPVAFVAWVPWIVALQGATPKWAALQGLCVGLSSHFFGFYWLLGMLQVFSGFPTWACAILMVLLCAYQGLSFSLLGWLFARGRLRGWPKGLIFVGAFAASETIFPYLFSYSFSATMHLVYPLVQAAEIGGPVLVALIVLAPNWGVAEVVRHWATSRQTARPLTFVQSFQAAGRYKLLLLFCVPVVAAVYGLVRIVQVDEMVRQAPKARVGIVQANISLTDKASNPDLGLSQHIKLTKKLVRQQQIDLAVWSETAVGNTIQEDEAALYYRKRVTRGLGVPTIVGAILWRPVRDAREYVFFNSALISDEKGKIVGRYDKQFLLPFGEYLPFGELYPKLYQWSPNSGRFSPGKSYQPLYFDGHPMASFICYEDLDADFVNKLMKHDNPELLINMTNDAWFGDTSEPWEHMALSQMRAVEQRRFLVRSTNSGVSGFVDPVGRLIQHTDTFEEAAIAEDIAWLKGPTLFRIWGNMPWKVLSVGVIFLAFYRRNREQLR